MPSHMKYMIGVDVGGTFTDFTLANAATGEVFNYKERSTPSDPSRAILTGIVEMLSLKQIDYKDIGYLVHGTTVATNTLIERKGASTALLITEGFKDIVEIGNQTRPSLYNLHQEKPLPLVPSHLRVEVPERIYQDGSVRQSIDLEILRERLHALPIKDVESIAICFLFSFVNPAHEKAASDLVRDIFPQAYISISHEVVAEFREYPRLSTTILNAYLGPVMRSYLENFQTAVKNIGIIVDPYITQSNGGTLSIQETVKSPVRTAVSGPSAGVIAAARFGELTGYNNLITFDMGGTSADISLVENGSPLVSVERKIVGWPARLPMLDIITIGAGGGSIARIDMGGALKVGPESAGAIPGPACYQSGGTKPTVTDANVLLQRINPQKILGGKMHINQAVAQDSIRKHISELSGLSILDAANGIIDVVNANMVRAIRVVSVERGYDPKDFTLMAFGGAGPLHAVALAKEIGIPRVLVPPSAGTLCSLGLLLTDIRSDHVYSRVISPSPAIVPDVKGIFEELEKEGTTILDKEQVGLGDRSFLRWIDARYKLQNYELMIPVQTDEFTEDGLTKIEKRFHSAHELTYGYARPNAEIEFVNFRLTAIGTLPKARIAQRPTRREAEISEPLRPVDNRKVYFKEIQGFVDCNIYQRSDIYSLDAILGPAIIEQMDATTVIPPGVACRADLYGNLIIEL